MLEKIKNKFNDAKDNDEFFYKNFFIKIILVFIILLVLVFIYTKVKVDKVGDNLDENQTFYSNLNKMKKAALSYYDENNIPKEVNESNKISLNKLIKKKKLKTLTDSNSNLCDGNNSYIKITKKENNYQIKINLTCGEDNDYIIIHVNNYDYCTNTFLCEENNSKEKDETPKEEETKEDINDIAASNNNNNSSNEKKYTKKKSSATPKYNSKKSTSKKLSSTYNTIKTSKGTIKVTIEEQDTKLFQYAKTSNPKFSSWTDWKLLEKTSCDTKEILCDSNDITCLKEVKMTQKEEVVNRINKKYVTTKKAIYNAITSSKEVCTDKEYAIIDNNIYIIDSIDSYGEIYRYLSNLNHSLNHWTYVSRESYDAAPADTYNTHYLYVGTDFSNCTTTCNTNPKFIYDKYVYNGNITETMYYSDNSCKVTQKLIYNYITNYVPVTVSRIENVYGKVCYKMERSRNLLNSGTTSYKWSSFNNKKLLNDGYYYTGKTKKK